MLTLDTIRRTWVEIDLRAFDRNVAALHASLPEGSKIIAVLKADAYSHGAVELARRCTPDRVAMIAVALFEEAAELRRAGISLPVLVLGPMTERQIVAAVELGLTIGIPGPEEMELVAAVARERDVVAHLKIDTGMGRMGVVETELPRVVELIRSAPRLRLEAIYSHFANASDPDDPMTAEQIARFSTLVETLREAGIDAAGRHLANSPAAVRGLVVPGQHVRAGLALVGAAPLDRGGARLEPVMRWRTEIARIKELPPGHAVGYGATYRTARASRIATLPVGYADGFSRFLSNRGEVLVRGRRAPVVGRVSMDLVTIDVTDVAEAAVSDEVVLMGGQGRDEVPVEEIARKVGTIAHDVFCAVTPRVARLYLDGGPTRLVTKFDL